MNTTQKAVLALLGTIFLWALMAVIVKSIVILVPAALLLFLRMFVAGIFFLPIFIRLKPWRKSQFNRLLLISLGSALNITFFMFGIQYTSASASQLIYAALPMLVLVIQRFIFQEKHGRSKTLGVIIGFAGLLFIIYRSSIEKGTTITGSLLGNLLIIIAMLSWTFYLLSSKKISKSFSPMEIGSTSILVGFCLATLIYFVSSFISPIQIHWDLNIILSSLYIGFCGTFLTYILYQYALSHLSSLSVSLASYIQPVATTILAVLLIGERLTFYYIAGSIMVLAGVFLCSPNILKINKLSKN